MPIQQVGDTTYIIDLSLVEGNEYPFNASKCSYCGDTMNEIIKNYKSETVELKKKPPPGAVDLNLTEKYAMMIYIRYQECPKCHLRRGDSSQYKWNDEIEREYVHSRILYYIHYYLQRNYEINNNDVSKLENLAQWGVETCSKGSLPIKAKKVLPDPPGPVPIPPSPGPAAPSSPLPQPPPPTGQVPDPLTTPMLKESTGGAATPSVPPKPPQGPRPPVGGSQPSPVKAKSYKHVPKFDTVSKGCLVIMYTIKFGLFGLLGIIIGFAINPLIGLLALCIVGAIGYWLYKPFFE